MSDFLPQDFLIELFRCCLEKKNKNILELCINNIKATYLQEELHKKFFLELKQQFKKLEHVPSVGVMKVAFRKSPDMLEFINEVAETDLIEGDVLIKGLETFVRQCIFIETFNESSVLYTKGEKDKAFQVFNAGNERIENFRLNGREYTRIFKDFPQRHMQRITQNNSHLNKMPIGIDELDYRIGGGFETGEFVLFLAESKRGKSWLLTHAGVNYARRGYGVYHLQVEGTRKKCEARYDSCWSGSIYSDINTGDITDAKFNSYYKILENIGRGEIFIDAPEKFNTITCPDIRQALIELKRKHNIKVALIDYYDLINPDGDKYGPNDERLRQRKIGRALKEIAMELDILIISVTQTSMVSTELRNDPEFCITREHLGEDKGKVQAVDFLFTMNQTDEEYKNKVMRLFMEATRDYEGREVIFIKTNFKHGRFYDRKRTLAEFFELPE